MTQIDIKTRRLGVNFNNEGLAEVNLWAPKAKTVELLLKDNGHKISLNRDEKGYWYTLTDNIKPGAKYMFTLDAEKDRPDPASLAQQDTVHGASVAVDLNSFKWDDEGWQNIALENYIIYELHTGTFTPEGTFAAIESKLDYLLELGINAIEIMPAAQFPGGRNWGYDGVLLFAVQNTYGGAHALQQLVNACHQRGIAVILDVVYNHLGPEGNYMADFGHFFTSKYHTPWGDAINFDDAYSDEVRRFFIENTLMWFRDFHIDALRFDAVHAIKDFSTTHILKEIKQHADKLMKSTDRTHYLIVELDLNDNRYINSLSEQGYGMDAQWIDEFHHALRVTCGQEKHGYYADFEGLPHLAKSYQDAYVYDGQYSPHRHKNFGVKVKDNPGKQFIVFAQNHDQVGNRMLGERLSSLVNFETQKLMAAAVLLSPYLPMLFMGEEWAEPNPFLYFVSHTDKQLADAVRKGRKAEFSDFHAKGEAPDPVAEETFKNSKLQWHLLQQDQHKRLFSYYQKLIALRKMHPVLKNLNRKQLDVKHDVETQTLILHRWDEDLDIICLMNFSASKQTIEMPFYSEQWHKIFDSGAEEWGGKHGEPEYTASDSHITLQPQSVVVYESSEIQAS